MHRNNANSPAALINDKRYGNVGKNKCILQELAGLGHTVHLKGIRVQKEDLSNVSCSKKSQVNVNSSNYIQIPNRIKQRPNVEIEYEMRRIFFTR